MSAPRRYVAFIIHALAGMLAAKRYLDGRHGHAPGHPNDLARHGAQLARLVVVAMTARLRAYVSDGAAHGQTTAAQFGVVGGGRVVGHTSPASRQQSSNSFSPEHTSPLILLHHDLYASSYLDGFSTRFDGHGQRS